MNQKLSFTKLLSLSLMLFAMFFGAGNMIFPPMLGQLSGGNFLQSVAGFVATDAGLSILGIAAVVTVGTKLDDLVGLVGPKFSVFMGVLIYLLIGPLFALPRTGTVSFEMAAVPFIPANAPTFLISVFFTAIFFGVTYILSINPSKLVDIVGKVLTPILLLSIAVIFIACVIHPVGEIGTATGDYTTIPFFRGMIEGYLALDGLAALAFAIVVINAVKDFGITESKSIVKYTLLAGVFAGVGLGVVYLALGFIGAQTSMAPLFENGSQLLSSVVFQLLGRGGNIILGLAVLMACLTTSIGLATSFADYFHTILPKYSYKSILTVVCIFSFAISNVGLTTMIRITLPALVMIYPPAIALIVLSFFNRWIKNKSEAYALALLFAFIISVFDGLRTAGISLGGLSGLLSRLPLFDLGLGWILPAIVGCLIGLLPCVNFLSKKAIQNGSYYSKDIEE
ncbi:branched-chain amino acid transport system II carrier protein [Aminipila luticellarii]|uniref:Branched-chain amino acid transport system carrier protein n=1 Tax=Aminipila luticellarii TaxID=2507160 RepID=A0A410PSF0_9FIRM|nr:branched-chain amino acid transport system II carrier protein [Aminipila luticellarii]QAT41819.1 branched-chain amino acid transport system II carrier protein [Aminipila luticellarii]